MKGDGRNQQIAVILFAIIVVAVVIGGGQLLWSNQLEANVVGDGETAVSLSQSVQSSIQDENSVLTNSQSSLNLIANNLPIINDNSLMPSLNPRTYQVQLPDHDFEIYVVERGETPNQIADKHNISAETLLGGNPRLSQESNALQAGAELIILPVDGVLHTVQPGETLESISELYDVPVAEIVAVESNLLEYPFYRLVPEAQLLIPGAKIGQFYWTAPKSVAGVGDGQWAVVGTNTYVWPINGRCLSQYYWAGHPAIDVGLSEGSAVVASDRGTVTYASWAAGSYFDYGNLIVINHGNGYETLYAHLSSIAVYPGQIVQQGEYIGGTGNTGRSSGPHIHFEIRQNDFRDNPLFYLSGPTQDCT
ncbi:MAG: peptidoglycan DD-metalloendopeptidase family protein [Chloroflexi bacterium]|nr:peptidoglycan DD-metalloendopeptidase family protein [Chloroflexota bacterium]